MGEAADKTACKMLHGDPPLGGAPIAIALRVAEDHHLDVGVVTCVGGYEVTYDVSGRRKEVGGKR